MAEGHIIIEISVKRKNLKKKFFKKTKNKKKR